MTLCGLCKHWRPDPIHNNIGECVGIPKAGYDEEDLDNSMELVSITNPCSTVLTKATFGCANGVPHGPNLAPI